MDKIIPKQRNNSASLSI